MKPSNIYSLVGAALTVLDVGMVPAAGIIGERVLAQEAAEQKRAKDLIEGVAKYQSQLNQRLFSVYLDKAKGNSACFTGIEECVRKEEGCEAYASIQWDRCLDEQQEGMVKKTCDTLDLQGSAKSVCENYSTILIDQCAIQVWADDIACSSMFITCLTELARKDIPEES